MTVWEIAESFVADKWRELKGGGDHFDTDQACEVMRSGLNCFDRIDSKLWLFLYSPNSANQLFEVSADPLRLAMALTKCASKATSGGMIFGIDCSTDWGTPDCLADISVFLVARKKRKV